MIKLFSVSYYSPLYKRRICFFIKEETKEKALEYAERWLKSEGKSYKQLIADAAYYYVLYDSVEHSYFKGGGMFSTLKDADDFKMRLLENDEIYLNKHHSVIRIYKMLDGNFEQDVTLGLNDDMILDTISYGTDLIQYSKVQHVISNMQIILDDLKHACTLYSEDYFNHFKNKESSLKALELVDSSYQQLKSSIKYSEPKVEQAIVHLRNYLKNLKKETNEHK